MTNFQELVKEFMVAAGQPVASEPRALTTDEAQFRYDLFIEEVNELEAAYKADDRIEMLDALCDILYIVLGTASVAGEDLREEIDMYLYIISKMPEFEYTQKHIQPLIRCLTDDATLVVDDVVRTTMNLVAYFGFTKENLIEGFNRVHRSNMSKFCLTESGANETIESYQNKGVETYWVKRGDLFVVLRTSDTKVMKSINYKPVNLEDLV